MTEVLRVAAVLLVMGALGTMVVYLLAFVAAAAWTLRSARQPDPLARELDAVLAEDLERLLSEVVGSAGPAGVGER